MSAPTDHDEDEEPGFFQKYRGIVIAGGVIIVAAVGFFLFGPKGEAPKKRSESVTMVTLPPPPPPPPTPPPTPPPPQEEKKVEETKQEFVEEPKPDSPPEPDKAPDDPAPMGSNIQGEGSDFGLHGKGGGGLIGGTGTGGGGGSKYGFYAGQVQSKVAEALRNHKKTRSASLRVEVRIWADSSGRVSKARVSSSSGNEDIDRAIRDEILTGLQLPSPPPDGMPMPIVMRISASRPQ